MKVSTLVELLLNLDQDRIITVIGTDGDEHFVCEDCAVVVDTPGKLLIVGCDDIKDLQRLSAVWLFRVEKDKVYKSWTTQLDPTPKVDPQW